MVEKKNTEICNTYNRQKSIKFPFLYLYNKKKKNNRNITTSCKEAIHRRRNINKE